MTQLEHFAGGRILTVEGRPFGKPAFERRALQTRAIVASHRVGRDQVASGLAVPYNVVVSDGTGGRELFTMRTDWEIVGPSETIPFKANHTQHLGHARILEAPSGLHLRGRIHAGMRHYAESKRSAPIGFASIESRQHSNGVREYLKVALFEVSLVRNAAHAPFTVIAVRDANELDDDDTVPHHVAEARSAMVTRAVYC